MKYSPKSNSRERVSKKSGNKNEKVNALKSQIFSFPLFYFEVFELFVVFFLSSSYKYIMRKSRLKNKPQISTKNNKWKRFYFFFSRLDLNRKKAPLITISISNWTEKVDKKLADDDVRVNARQFSIFWFLVLIKNSKQILRKVVFFSHFLHSFPNLLIFACHRLL